MSSEVRRILLELPGVTDVYASSAFQVVEVTYDENKINDLEIAVKLDEAGYLGEWTMPVEVGARAHVRPRRSPAPSFRHSAVYETTKKTVSFAQRMTYQGRPALALPRHGHLQSSARRRRIMPKKREIAEYSDDPAAQQMLARAEELGLETAFTRADKMVPCNIGAAGMCCKQCGMGPCRLTKSGEVGRVRCNARHDAGAQPDAGDRRRRGCPLRSRARHGIPAQGGCQR